MTQENNAIDDEVQRHVARGYEPWEAEQIASVLLSVRECAEHRAFEARLARMRGTSLTLVPREEC